MDYPPICPFCGATLYKPYEHSIGKHYGCYYAGTFTRGFKDINDWLALCWNNGERISNFYTKEHKEYKPYVGNGKAPYEKKI